MARYQKSTRNYSALSVTVETKQSLERVQLLKDTACHKSERLQSMQCVSTVGKKKKRTMRKCNQKQKVVCYSVCIFCLGFKLLHCGNFVNRRADEWFLEMMNITLVRALCGCFASLWLCYSPQLIPTSQNSNVFMTIDS